MPLLTLAEAAEFLRKSQSWLYQNLSVPRHRPPGCRTYLFDEAELLAWVKSGESSGEIVEDDRPKPAAGRTALDMPGSPVYHRNARYR